MPGDVHQAIVDYRDCVDMALLVESPGSGEFFSDAQVEKLLDVAHFIETITLRIDVFVFLMQRRLGLSDDLRHKLLVAHDQFSRAAEEQRSRGALLVRVTALQDSAALLEKILAAAPENEHEKIQTATSKSVTTQKYHFPLTKTDLRIHELAQEVGLLYNEQEDGAGSSRLPAHIRTLLEDYVKAADLVIACGGNSSTSAEPAETEPFDHQEQYTREQYEQLYETANVLAQLREKELKISSEIQGLVRGGGSLPISAVVKIQSEKVAVLKAAYCIFITLIRQANSTDVIKNDVAEHVMESVARVLQSILLHQERIVAGRLATEYVREEQTSGSTPGASELGNKTILQEERVERASSGSVEDPESTDHSPDMPSQLEEITKRDESDAAGGMDVGVLASAAREASEAGLQGSGVILSSTAGQALEASQSDGLDRSEKLKDSSMTPQSRMPKKRGYQAPDCSGNQSSSYPAQGGDVRDGGRHHH